MRVSLGVAYHYVGEFPGDKELMDCFVSAPPWTISPSAARDSIICSTSVIVRVQQHQAVPFFAQCLLNPAHDVKKVRIGVWLKLFELGQKSDAARAFPG